MAAPIAVLLVNRLTDWGVDATPGLPGRVNGRFQALLANRGELRLIETWMILVAVAPILGIRLISDDTRKTTKCLM